MYRTASAPGRKERDLNEKLYVFTCRLQMAPLDKLSTEEEANVHDLVQTLLVPMNPPNRSFGKQPTCSFILH